MKACMIITITVVSVGGLARYEYCARKEQNEQLGIQRAALFTVARRVDLLERGVGKTQNTVADVKRALRVMQEDTDAFTEHTRAIMLGEARARAIAVVAASTYGEAITARVHALEAELTEATAQLKTIKAEVVDTGVLHSELQTVTQDVSTMYASLHRDPAEKIRAMIIPTVLVSAERDVGSGTVIFSGVRPGSTVVETYVLTAYHIVLSIATEDRPDDRVCAVKYDTSNGTWKDVTRAVGHVVAGSAALDLALIRLEIDGIYPAVGRVLPRKDIPRLQVFTPVYAVGCPLGYAPTPTYGEIAARQRVVDGQNYWVINAPTIFGNSGGGVFAADTYELIGVLSRVSAYNNLVNVAVPHLGFLVPVGTIHKWLEEEGYGFILD